MGRKRGGARAPASRTRRKTKPLLLLPSIFNSHRPSQVTLRSQMQKDDPLKRNNFFPSGTRGSGSSYCHFTFLYLNRRLKPAARSLGSAMFPVEPEPLVRTLGELGFTRFTAQPPTARLKRLARLPTQSWPPDPRGTHRPGQDQQHEGLSRKPVPGSWAHTPTTKNTHGHSPGAHRGGVGGGTARTGEKVDLWAQAPRKGGVDFRRAQTGAPPQSASGKPPALTLREPFPGTSLCSFLSNRPRSLLHSLIPLREMLWGAEMKQETPSGTS